MRAGVLAIAGIGLAACAPEGRTDPACARASEERGEARSLAAEGRLSRALESIEDANAACPASRFESWDTEVTLLAQLRRCQDATALADAIDAAAWRGDGAWLSAAVARHECEAGEADPDALFDEAERREAAGDRTGARRGFERAFAASHERPRADFIRWTHKEPGPIAWVGGGSVVVADQSRASLFSTSDWRERMRLDARGTIRWIAASPDGRLVATSDGDEVRIWDLRRAELRATVEGSGPVELSNDTLTFVRRGAVVSIDASTGRRKAPPATARRPEPATPPRLVGAGRDEPVLAVSSPDGATRVYRDVAGLHSVDGRTATDRLVVPTATAPVEDIAVLANGDAIAVRGVSRPGGHLWTAAGPLRVPALDGGYWRHGADLVVPTHETRFDVLDALTGARLRSGTLDRKDAIDISPDGWWVSFSSDGRHRFVEVRSDAPDTTSFLGAERDVGFDPSDPSLFITRDESTLRWRQVPALSLVRSQRIEQDGATSILEGPGEPAVVVRGPEKERVVSLASGRVLFEDVPMAGVSLVRRADGSFLRVGREYGESSRSPFRVFDPQGKVAATFQPYAHECEGFGVPPDGRWLAGGCKEGSIVFWSIETYQVILVLRPFPGYDSGYALEPATGRIEIFGDPPLDPVCRAGARSLPFDACEDVVEPGLVARVLGSPGQ